MPNGVDTVDCPLSTSALSIPTHCLTLSLTLTRSLQHSVATFQHYRRWLQTGSPLVCQLTHTEALTPRAGALCSSRQHHPYAIPCLRHPSPRRAGGSGYCWLVIRYQSRGIGAQCCSAQMKTFHLVVVQGCCPRAFAFVGRLYRLYTCESESFVLLCTYGGTMGGAFLANVVRQNEAD